MARNPGIVAEAALLANTIYINPGLVGNDYYTNISVVLHELCTT